MVRIVHKLYYMMMSALLSMSVMSCGKDDPGGYDDSDNVSLMLQLVTGGADRITRADDLHDETDSEYIDFEDGIDIGDLGIFLFASMEGEEEETLVLKCANVTAATNKAITVAGGPGNYTLSIDIARKLLHDALGGRILSPNDTEKVSLRLLVLANASSPGTNAQRKWNEINGTTYAAVIEQLSKWRFAVSYIYNNFTVSEDVTELYSNRKKNCPMFGTVQYHVTQEALYDSSPENRLYMGEISMLRCLAKVRVVDNIPKNEDGYPKIIAAAFTGTQDAATQLPYNALTYSNGQQVHTANIDEPDKELHLRGAVTYRLGIIPDNWTMTPATRRTGATRIGYIPEQLIGDVYDEEVTGLPVYDILVSYGINSDGTDITQEFRVPMTQYKGQKFEFGDEILRNHIYTLSVNSAGDDGLTVKVRVRPWIRERQHIELQ